MRSTCFFIMCVTFLAATPALGFREKAQPLKSAASLDALIVTTADKKLVMLGEASHGTHEYYVWRDKISRRLIEEQEFNFIVVEGDFASLYELNRYVKNMPGAARSARKVLTRLNRWPQWMWANEEVVALAEWLRAHNDKLPAEKRVGFYGLDVYDEWRSKQAVLDFLQKRQRDLYRQVRTHYACFAPYKKNSWAYAKAVQQGKPSCAGAAQGVVQIIENSRDTLLKLTDPDYFYLLQNAEVVRGAELFYRQAITSADESSWNSRVTHMHNTINHLLALYGADAKGIVWAHNTHIGDASYTTMLQSNHQNIGRLTRKGLGRDQVLLVGFTTYSGSVLAGASWGSAMLTMEIPKATDESLEGRLNQAGLQIGLDAFYLMFDDEDRDSDAMLAPLGNRAVGVVYNPANDRAQYEQSIVPLRYDALVFFAETKALRALD